MSFLPAASGGSDGAPAGHARSSGPRVLVYSAQLEPIGGIESHVLEFCRRFSDAGWRLTLMSSRCALSPGTRDELARCGVELRLNTARASTASPAAKWAWTLATLGTLASRRFDAVYVNGQGRNAATVLKWYAGRVRTVHHHHTACDAGDLARWPAPYRDAMRRADALVVCADFIRHRMRAALARRDVEVAYCFSRSVPAPVRRPGAAEPVTFGYFGRLIPEKGIEWIRRLARDPRLADVRWRIWGGEGAYRAGDFAAHPNVEYLGPYAGAEGLASALAAIDCFCLFSTHPEGVPVALLESMAAGRAWIATPQGGIPELVHDARSCALVELDDYDAVVAACAAMRDRLRAGEIDAERQRAFYRSRFAADTLVAQWRAVLLGPGAALPGDGASHTAQDGVRRPLPLRVLPARARQSLLARHYRSRRDGWTALYAHAPLRYAPGVAMIDLQPGDAISDSIAFTGSYEDGLSARLAELGRRGGTLVDVGANLGYVTLLWAAAASDNVVLAIEASPRIHPRLVRNVGANGLDGRVRTVHCAAGRERGAMPFDLGPDDQTGWGGLVHERGVGRRVVEVPVRTLDELCADISRIDLLKIDVEGAEPWVLEGAGALLASGVVREIWFEENRPRMAALGIEEGRATELLQRCGYAVTCMGDSRAAVREFVARPRARGATRRRTRAITR